MPKKIRTQEAGFKELVGKGSHTNWIHPRYFSKLTLSGSDGADAKPYQEKEVNRAIEEIEKTTDKE